MRIHRIAFAAAALALAFAPAGPAAAKHWRAKNQHHAQHHHVAGGSWDGRWAGAWGGSDPTAVNISGNRVVSYEYGGATNPVGYSHVTAKRIVYGEADTVVTMTRTGANTARATLKSSQGNGTAVLTRQ